MGCCGGRSIKYDKIFKISIGKVDYSFKNAEEILELLKAGDKVENQEKLVKHYEEGWRPFHLIKKDKKDSFVPTLLSVVKNQQSKFFYLDEDSLKETYESDTVLIFLFKNPEVAKRLFENLGNDYTLQITDESIRKEFNEQYGKLDEKNKDQFKKIAEITGIVLSKSEEKKPEATKAVEPKKDEAKKEEVNAEVKPEVVAEAK